VSIQRARSHRQRPRAAGTAAGQQPDLIQPVPGGESSDQRMASSPTHIDLSQARGKSTPRRRSTKKTARRPLYTSEPLPLYTCEPLKPEVAVPTPFETAADDAAAARVAPKTYAVELDDARVDPDAMKVVRRLTRYGHEGYLVGGCVRDLLLGRAPKDFDVATSARPDDVRRLFRNSRIIGRRFKLVHVLFGGNKVIETATFRRNPQPEDERGGDLLIRQDNVFGEAHEDALRRDFTINGLFYDLERKVVLDWVGGMPDIECRTVRTIGEPIVRFLEDPVRILRAIKFAARLDLGVAPDLYDAVVQCRGSLAMAARPRLFEELMRLMRSGAAHRSIWLAWETGVLDVVLPELAAYLSDQSDSDGLVWKMLSAVDRRTRERDAPFDDVVLCAVLLIEPMREACTGTTDRVGTAFEFLEPVVDRLNVPRRIADAIRRIVAMMPRLMEGKGGKFRRTPVYLAAREVMSLYEDALDGTPRAAPLDEQPSPAKAPRRKRARRAQ
jgi:poly(A) polymerase